LVSHFNNYDAFGVVWNSLRQFQDTLVVVDKATSLAYEVLLSRPRVEDFFSEMNDNYDLCSEWICDFSMVLYLWLPKLDQERIRRAMGVCTRLLPLVAADDEGRAS